MTPRPSPAGSWALRSSGVMVALAVAVVMTPVVARATPANRAALEKHYDRFLAKGLDKCRTCHLPSENRAPENLQEFPHNPFGDRLRVVGERLAQQGLKSDLSSRLGIVAKEDADGDGVDNETE